TPTTKAARASPRARAIQPHGVTLSDDVASGATVFVGLVSAFWGGASEVVFSLRGAARARGSQPQTPLLSDGGSPAPVSVGTVVGVVGSVAVVSVSGTGVGGSVAVVGLGRVV